MGGLTRRREPLKVEAPDPLPKREKRVVAGVDDRIPLVFCTVEQAAYALGIKAQFAWALVAKGDRGDPDGLRAVRIGTRLRRVPIWEIQRYARSLAGDVADTVPDARNIATLATNGTSAGTPQVASQMFLAPLSPSEQGGQ